MLPDQAVAPELSAWLEGRRSKDPAHLVAARATRVGTVLAENQIFTLAGLQDYSAGKNGSLKKLFTDKKDKSVRKWLEKELAKYKPDEEMAAAAALDVDVAQRTIQEGSKLTMYDASGREKHGRWFWVEPQVAPVYNSGTIVSWGKKLKRGDCKSLELIGVSSQALMVPEPHRSRALTLTAGERQLILVAKTAELRQLWIEGCLAMLAQGTGGAGQQAAGAAGDPPTSNGDGQSSSAELPTAAANTADANGTTAGGSVGPLNFDEDDDESDYGISPGAADDMDANGGFVEQAGGAPVAGGGAMAADEGVAVAAGPGLFGVPISERGRLALAPSDGHRFLPAAIDHLARWLLDEGASCPGLFSAALDYAEVEGLASMLEASAIQGQYLDLSGESTFTGAGVLKKWFRDMPEPLLTNAVFPVFVRASTETSREECATALSPYSCTTTSCYIAPSASLSPWFVSGVWSVLTTIVVRVPRVCGCMAACRCLDVITSAVAQLPLWSSEIMNYFAALLVEFGARAAARGTEQMTVHDLAVAFMPLILRADYEDFNPALAAEAQADVPYRTQVVQMLLEEHRYSPAHHVTSPHLTPLNYPLDLSAPTPCSDLGC